MSLRDILYTKEDDMQHTNAWIKETGYAIGFVQQARVSFKHIGVTV